MKRAITILLTLALLLALAVPFGAHAIDPPCYVMPYSGYFDTSVVKGGNVSIQLFLPVNLPTGNFEIKNSTDICVIEIYKGDIDNFFSQDDPTLVETRSIPASIAYNRAISFTWTADNRYPVGDYTMVILLVSNEGVVYNQSWFIDELHVLSAPTPARDMMLAVMDEDFNFEPFDGVLTQKNGRNTVLVPLLLPAANTTNRTFTFTSDDTSVVSVAQVNKFGYVEVGAGRAGAANLTVDFGDFKKTFRILVEMKGLRITLTPGQTTLCPGQTDAPKAGYFQDTADKTWTVRDDQVKPEWISDHPEIASVKDGVVTAVSPGTATVTVQAGTAIQSVQYTVRAHDLPADAPTTARTATQPGYQIGRCSICGEENARNIIEKPVFSDTAPDAWYAPHVDYVYENELMNGVGDHSFAPNRAMTRAMVATVLYRIAGSPETEGKSPFSDVPEGQWYSDAIAWAAGKGIVTGYGNGQFRPNKNITREQFAAILYRYTASLEVPMDESGDLKAFPDEGKVQDYARDAMRWAVKMELINGVASGGVTELRPQNNTTRAQFATIVSRYQSIEWEPEQTEPGVPETPAE